MHRVHRIWMIAIGWVAVNIFNIFEEWCACWCWEFLDA